MHARPKDIMDLLILNQYFDALQEVGKNPSTKIVFLPNEENATRNGVLQALDGGGKVKS